jgi:hypothetical protein
MSFAGAVAANSPTRSFDAMSKRWAFLIAALGLAMAVTVAGAQSTVSCQRNGGFSSDFSRDFDVVRTECRISSINHAPVVKLFESSPYVEVTLPD